MTKTTAGLLVLAAALLCGLTASAHADVPTLYIGDFGGQTILRYSATSSTTSTPINGPGNPWQSGYTPEGITAGVNGLPGSTGPILFVVDRTAGTVEELNANAPVGTNPVVNPAFITIDHGAAAGSGIAISPNGQYLYVTSSNQNEIFEYSAVTGALLASVSLPGAHDVVVGADGSVYASGYLSDDGVVKFTANLTDPTTFIAPDANGLNHAAGMVFDGSGNLWVSNNPQGNAGVSMVQEYNSKTGALIQTVSGSPLLNPLGLALGPDGNIYVANLGDLSTGAGSAVLEINDSTGALSTYIGPSGSGVNPKYVYFSSDFVNYSPEPNSAILVGLGAGGFGLASWLRRRRAALG